MGRVCSFMVAGTTLLGGTISVGVNHFCWGEPRLFVHGGDPELRCSIFRKF